MLRLVFDHIDGNMIVPNLVANFQSLSHEQEWPYTSYPRLAYYAQDHRWPIKVTTLDNHTDQDTFYLISLAWFDFKVDWFALLSEPVIQRLRDRKLTLLFYYHEGDNPYTIKSRLDQLCEQYQMPLTCYRFISANSSAALIKNFVYFSDHELLYWRQNRHHAALPWHNRTRRFRYTALNRTHKWWRATVMADLKRSGRLRNCQWSYGDQDIGDQPCDNPLRLAAIPGIRPELEAFMKEVPYYCDSLTSDQHNQHDLLDPSLYVSSYFHLVLETMFDLGGSNGAFITEKTYKCIKHAVPFVIVGAPGSLQILRDNGYKVFDNMIDNSYDLELNNDRRWTAVKHTLDQILSNNLKTWHSQCQQDAEHNQRLFLDIKIQQLNTLKNRLYESLD